MDVTGNSFDWSRARSFLKVAEHGSLSAAARVLGQTQPTLGRQLSALEEELGTVLFERVGRGLELTPTGEQLLTHVRAMADAADRLALTVSGQAQSVQGLVRISAADVMASHILPEIIKDLRTQHPKLEVQIIAANSVSDLLRREADIAIRHLRPEEPSLIAKLVSEERAGFYASQEYLRQNGTPKTTDDLAKHTLIGFDDIDEMVTYLQAYDLPVSKDSFPLSSSSGSVVWQMVQSGLGISVMSERVAARTPNVVEILPESLPVKFPTWLTAHRELLTSGKIRVVYDALEAGLKRL